MQRSRRHLLLATVVAVMTVVPTWMLYAQNRNDGIEVYRVSRQSQWEQWTFPVGTLQFSRTGAVTPTKFIDRHNAALNAGEFTHKLVSGQEIQGGAWKAGSNEATANNILDGDPDTYWQPDADAHEVVLYELETRF